MFRDLELGAMRAHILHHASRAPVYGSWMLEELGRHGHAMSYGTLYPALHRMEEEGQLAREDRVEGGSGSTTPRRRRASRSPRGCAA